MDLPRKRLMFGSKLIHTSKQLRIALVKYTMLSIRFASYFKLEYFSEFLPMILLLQHTCLSMKKKCWPIIRVDIDYWILMIGHSCILLFLLGSKRHICLSKKTMGDREICKTYWIQHVKLHKKHIILPRTYKLSSPM